MRAAGAVGHFGAIRGDVTARIAVGPCSRLAGARRRTRAWLTADGDALYDPSMALTVQGATPRDVDELLPMIAELWRIEKIPFDADRVRALLHVLFDDARAGTVWIARSERAIVGYMILTFGFSVEHGGRDALIDELYVSPDQRGSGLGTHLLDVAFAACIEAGITRLHLEVDHTNPRAAALYERLGFEANDRALLTKRIG